MARNKNKKTTRGWFHDTAYCFDYSWLSHGTRSETWTRTARTPRDFKLVIKTWKINALWIFSEHGAKLQHLKYMHLQPIRYQSSEWVANKNSLFRCPVPRLPAIDVCPQLARTFHWRGIGLQVFALSRPASPALQGGFMKSWVLLAASIARCCRFLLHCGYGFLRLFVLHFMLAVYLVAVRIPAFQITGIVSAGKHPQLSWSLRST